VLQEKFIPLISEADCPRRPSRAKQKCLLWFNGTGDFPWDSFKLVTEFGQWVHASAGFAISAIEYVIQPDRVFVHLGADFFMRDAYTKARPFPLAVISSRGQWRSGATRPFDIAGPLCFAGDYLAHKKNLT